MSTHEIDIGYSWIYSTLTGDETLMEMIPDEDCHRHFAPPSTPQPYLVMDYRPPGGTAGADVQKFGGRAYTDLLFELRATGPSKLYTEIALAASRVDDLLQGTNIAVSGGTIMACFRHEPIEEDVLIEGEAWCNLGGAYRMLIAQS